MAFEITAFKYDTYDAAKADSDIIDAAEGYPLPDGVTLTYAAIQQHPINSYYYIVADDVTYKYLSNPQIITIPDLRAIENA